jgi:DNA polymerase (family 10)
MDPRSAAHVLSQIASHLELRGEQKFKIRAYEQAARALLSLDTDDLGALDRQGTLAATRGLGPATLSVVRDLIETGESRYLEKLRADIPRGLLELLDVPGLGVPRIHKLHQELGVDSLDALEAAARDGRLAKMKGLGARTAERILKGIAFARSSGTRSLYPRAAAEATTLLAMVRSHPGVQRAEVAGSVRRHRETAGDVDIVALCDDPHAVARSFARAPGVREVRDAETASPSIVYVDGARLDLVCVTEPVWALALWLATGSKAHVREVAERLAARGYTVDGQTVRDARGDAVPLPDEQRLYAIAGLAWIPPEMREAIGEVERAASNRMPTLLEVGDIRGVLHCHSTWSDGKATIAQMAEAARTRGWSYIGITDHSQAAFYAGGLAPDAVLAQHDEIDALNVGYDGFRILKGIEADILADGAIDYDAALLERFDFVVGSVHSRFNMDRTTMTDRVLRALDNEFLTVLGHPTGRLLLSRDAYAIDMDAVLAKAGANGVAVELNADPHRLDLDWRLIPRALECGARIEIGPDAHSTGNLDYVAIGVGMARKAGVERRDVLNAGSVDDVLAFARARRARTETR